MTNLTVLDGAIGAIPFEPGTFDIVMTAHVLGADFDQEIAALERVVKDGGFLLDCMGEDDRKRPGPEAALLRHGFSWSHYVSVSGGDVYRYCKQVHK